MTELAMPRFGESDVEPIAYRTNAKGDDRSNATEAERQAAARADPPLDHHVEELLAALSDHWRRGGEAGADAMA